MAKQKSWGVSWVGDEQVLIHESETDVSTGMLSYSHSSSNSLVVRMDLERYQYERARVEDEKGFSEEFSPDRFYRRLDGHNYSHPVAERDAFDRRYQHARRVAAAAPSKTVTPAVLLDEQLNTPLLEHVGDDDPAVILECSRKGVGIGPDSDSLEERIRPSGKYGSYVVFSPAEITIVTGRTATDRVRTISYDEISGGEVSFGVLKHRLTLEHPDGPFHVWVSQTHDKADLEAAVDEITAKTQTEPFASSSPTSRAKAWWNGLDEDDSESSPAFDPSEVETATKWWLGARVTVFLPIVAFLAYLVSFAVVDVLYGSSVDPIENALVVGTGLFFILSIPIGSVAFSICASKDLAALAAETGHGTPRHPIIVYLFLAFTGGLYALYYLYWRWSTFSA